ncbi:L,D-transpeptidase [Blautia schinkii]|nr:L,D-transpeptidase [Blautia schinkii]
MKKRVVAVLLSLTLCLATVLETGAAVFDSQASGDTVAAQSLDDFTSGDDFNQVPADNGQAAEPGDVSGEIDIPTDVTPVPDEVTPTPDEVTPTPDVTVTPDDSENPDNNGDGLPDDVDLFVPENPDKQEVEDPFGDGTEEIDVFSSADDGLLTAFATVSTEVNKTDWEETEAGSGKYKLHKTSDTYYTAADGIVYIKTVTDKSAPSTDTVAHNGNAGYYLFDAEGVMITGQSMMKPGTPGYSLETEEEFYYTDSSVAELYQEYDTEGNNTVCTPVTSDLGQLKLKYWLWTGTTFRYYDAAGKFLSMAELKEINLANGKYSGYYGIGGSYYYLDENGTPLVGEYELTDVKTPGKYYFKETLNEKGIPGEMFRGGWYCKDTSKGDQWLYYKGNGTLYERGIVATRLDVSVMGDYTFLLSADGYILKGTMKKASNNAYYCTDKYGRVYKEKLVKYNNARYYFDKNGKRVNWKNCWHRCKGAGNRFYYFGGTAGKVVEKKGWQKVTNTNGKMYGWFYFSSSGNHYVDKWAQGGYFKPNGQLASGVTEVDGKTYFFMVSNSTTHRGSLFKSTWISYKKKWYYAQSNGVLHKSGWKKIDGNYYYFQGDFTAKTNAFVKRGNVNGYLDANGKFCTGWVITSNANNQVKYINPDGTGFVKNTSKVIDGLRYYFDKNGYRRNDLTSVYRGPYYVTVDRVNGVMTVYDSSRTVPVKTIRVSVGLPGMDTPWGEYTLQRSARWQPLMGPSWGQYGTHVYLAGQGGIFVHSVASPQMNNHNLPVAEYNKLGNPASHGCIRACVADAKWVYDNCNGARIKIFDGTYNANEAMKGPLGRRALVKYKGGGYDPTDPAI